MFLSKVLGTESTEAINIKFLNNSLQLRGFTVVPQKNRDLEAGVSTISFEVQKQGRVPRDSFVMRINLNRMVAAGYIKGHLVREQEVSNDQQLGSVIQQMFASAQNQRHGISFDEELRSIRSTAERKQKNFKNYDEYHQEMKVQPEYSRFLKKEKEAYQQIAIEARRTLAEKNQISELSQKIVEPLETIEELKQDLASTNLQAEEARSHLTNVRDTIEEQIRIKKEETKDLPIYTLNEDTFKDYLNSVVRMKDLENKLKCLVV